jgi:phage tail protein X
MTDYLDITPTELEGKVYGYVIETVDGDHIDSCWGFYGHEYATTEAVEAAHREAAEIDKRTDALYAARSWAFAAIAGMVA